MCKIVKKIINIFDKVKKNKLKLDKKQGGALVETILLISISLVIIMTIFYPIFKTIINDSLASVANWFSTALLSINMT